ASRKANEQAAANREARTKERQRLEQQLAEAQQVAAAAMQKVEEARKAAEQLKTEPDVAVQPTPDENTLAMKVETPAPKANKNPTPARSIPKATFEKNGLGMKFAPVGDVLFSIWHTRLQDFD